MAKNLNWLKLTVHHPPIAAEALSGLLFDAGAQGVWEDLPDPLGRLVSRAGFEPSESEKLGRLMPAIIANLSESFELDQGTFEFSLELEERHDWAEKWKEGLKPVLVTSNLALAPTWWPEDDLPEAGNVLRLDPGLAFGSGHHATTFLCLKLLAEMAPSARRILDVGAGSGILSIAAAALNPAARVTGVDNDPDTIEVAYENAALNKLSDLEFSAGNLDAIEDTFDLIVANITLSPLVELAPAISKKALPGSRLILSGLLDSQVDEAAAVYTALGWGLDRRLGRDEWAALAFSKGGPDKHPAREEA